MNTLFYMQEQRLYRFSDGRSEPVTCQAVEQYIGNLQQIHRKKEWKTQGSGADFMGIRQEGLDLSDIHPSDSVCTADGRLVYGATLQGGAAIQAKPINDLAQAEGLLLRHTDHVRIIPPKNTFLDLFGLGGRSPDHPTEEQTKAAASVLKQHSTNHQPLKIGYLGGGLYPDPRQKCLYHGTGMWFDAPDWVWVRQDGRKGLYPHLEKP